MAQILAVIIFLAMFILIITEIWERHIVTLGCALLTLVLVFGLCMHSPSAIIETLNIHSIFSSGFWHTAGEASEASAGINWETIVFIAGMMIMVEGMAKSGFFRWLCMKIAKLVKYQIIPIFITFMLLSFVLAMFIDSITVILFLAAVTDKYALHSIKLTIEVSLIAVVCNTFFGIFASWLITKFQFKGKKIISTLIDLPLTVSPIIAGLIYVLTFGRQSFIYPYLKAMGIRIIFAVPGIVLATIFVTFPFISRELIPVLTSQGTDEEEAAALMGANGWTIFWKVTFPHIKWPLLYGIVLCTARAMGEFGAVSVLSGHLRGRTNTMPLYIELLYQGYDFTGAFAVSAILVLMAVIILVLRSVLEYKGQQAAKAEKGQQEG